MATPTNTSDVKGFVTSHSASTAELEQLARILAALARTPFLQRGGLVTK